jgi:DNA-binding MarR family transcriptional regulator
VLRTLGAVAALTAPPSEGDAVTADSEDARPEAGIGDVARALAVDGSTASRLVDQAVAAGYVARLPGRTDRRRARLEVTTEGAKLGARVQEIRRRWLADLTAGWSEDEVTTLAELLHRFIAADAPTDETTP